MKIMLDVKLGGQGAYQSKLPFLKRFKTFRSSNIPFSELHAGSSQSFKAKKCCNYSSSLVHLPSKESLEVIFKYVFYKKRQSKGF